MSTMLLPRQDEAVTSSLRFLRNLLADYPAADVAVRAWDGTTWSPSDSPRCTIVLAHRGAVRRMFSPPKMLSLCDAYLYGDVDLEGDVEAYWGLIEYLFVHGAPRGRLERKRIERELADIPDKPARPQRQVMTMTGAIASLDRDRQAIASHYDVSNDFYRWDFLKGPAKGRC